MKKLFTILLIFQVVPRLSQNLLSYPESIIYDSSHQRYLISNYQTGDIIQIDNQGVQSYFVQAQQAIQGLEIVGNSVYVGAGKKVRGFDLEAGQLVMDIAINGVSNLNDITADDSGNLYVSDVFGTKIIKVNIASQSWWVFVEGNGIDHPNGLFYDRPYDRILVCSYRANSPIQSINLADSSVTTLAETNLTECDGITRDKYHRYYVTSWVTNSIYRFDSVFSVPPVLIYSNNCGPADISYNSSGNELAIPLQGCNSWDVYPIDPPLGINDDNEPKVIPSTGLSTLSDQISLTFSARNSAGYIPLDSILVENITHGTDTVLFYPDTILVTEMIVGSSKLNASSKEIFLRSNFPNPFSGRTFFNLFLPDKQFVEITIHDLSGRELIAEQYPLSAGWHSFQFSGGGTPFFILTVTGIYSAKSIRMMAIPAAKEEKSCLVYKGPGGVHRIEKNITAGGFSYHSGDLLRYTGFAQISGSFPGSDYLEDNPVENKNYLFEIKEGIPCSGIPYLIYEEKVYHTILINDQCWMKENLDVGIRLDADSNQTDNGIFEKYCYNNNPVNCITYGGLYQWNEVMQYSMTQGSQGICPSGWHIPTDSEWSTLSNFLGGDDAAGGHVKEAGTSHWMAPNTGADNSTGFSALPAGMYFDGSFQHFRTNVELWSSTHSFSPYSWYRILYNDNAHLTRTNYFERWTARSVRCLKN